MVKRLNKEWESVMKKKISFCLLCGVLLLGVTGCGNYDTSSLSYDNNDYSTTY